MNSLPHEPKELQGIYQTRFDSTATYRNAVWKVLTHQFFQKFVSPASVVLDLGCGYGEFINNIVCGSKIAMDLNPSAGAHLNADVTLLEQDCSKRWALPDDSLDVVFTSNFFEHLPDKRALFDTLSEAHRCLKSSGIIIAMGPNIKYTNGSYWDFYDHYLALTELSMQEVLQIRNFRVQSVVGQFLPYTMINAVRYPLFVLSCYLKFKALWKVFGKQFLVIASKP